MLQRMDQAYEKTFSGTYVGDTGGGYAQPVVASAVADAVAASVPGWIIQAAARPAALTATAAVAPAGGTGTAAGGWDTAAHRDTAITLLNNLKTRVDELETKLRTLGALT